METKYRICKNVCGEFKIQRLSIISIFNKILWKRWVDAGFIYDTLVKFDSYEEAEKLIQKFKETERTELARKEWDCQGEIF